MNFIKIIISYIKNKLLLLPATWMSTVYLIENSNIEPYTVVDYDIEFDIHTGEIHKDVMLKHQTAGFSVFHPEDDFGVVIFKTHAGAKRALKLQNKEVK